jgi:hypothetical protein
MVIKVTWGFPIKLLQHAKTHIIRHVNIPLFLSDFNHKWVCRQCLVKSPVTNSTKIRSAVLELVHGDGQTGVAKLMGAFLCNFKVRTRPKAPVFPHYLDCWLFPNCEVPCSYSYWLMHINNAAAKHYFEISTWFQLPHLYLHFTMLF